MSEMCQCDIEYDIGPTLFNATEPRARKPHCCCECKETIPKGTKYQRIEGLWDGDWGSYTTCITCANIRQTLAPCSAFGYLRSDIWDCLGLDYVTGHQVSIGEE